MRDELNPKTANAAALIIEYSFLKTGNTWLKKTGRKQVMAIEATERKAPAKKRFLQVGCLFISDRLDRKSEIPFLGLVSTWVDSTRLDSAGLD